MDFFAKRRDDIDDDPTDFAHSSLQALDASLRCPICKEFFKNPVLTPCGHSFCSACVRLALDADSTEKRACPLCSTKSLSSEKDLRANSALEEVVDRYKASRSLLLDLAKLPPPPQHILPRKKRKPWSSNGPAGGPAEGSGSRDGGKKGDAIEILDEEEDDEEVEVEEVSDQENGRGKRRSPALAKGLATCPVCEKIVPEVTINGHLDSNCKKFLLGPFSKPKPDSWFGSGSSTATKVGLGLASNGAASSATKNGVSKSTTTSAKDPSPPAVRLSRPNYNLLSEKQLRGKLEEFALSTVGSKPLLEARHRQWILLFNSNLDSSHPAKESELKAELRKWDVEKERETKAKKKRAEKDPVSVIEYEKAHETDFASLERQVRERMATASKKRKAEAAEGDIDAEAMKTSA